jgi:O-antigen/teichoic acid export membrane protein
LSTNRVQAGKAAFWSATDIIGRQAVTFIVSIVLARLLTPADFGAVAISTFFATFVMAAVQQSLSVAIIQRHGAADDEVSSIFWWNLIISALLALLLAAIGPSIATYFNIPVLGPLLVAAAVQIVLTGFGAVHVALLNRDLRFAEIAKAGIPATIVSGALGITLALLGAGVWAIAAQLVSAAGLTSAAMWIVSKWRPRRILRAAGLDDAVRFARWISLSACLEVLYGQGFALVLGKLYGPGDLGLYGRAANTQQVPASVISGVISRVALPLFSVRRDDPEALARGLLAANRMAMVIALPALVGLALTADVAIRVLFGPQWGQAAPALSILAWAGALYPLHANNLQALLASGRSNIFFRVEITKKLAGVILVIIGSFFGIMGLAWSQLLFSAIALLINARPSAHYFGCGLGRQISDLSGIIAATAIMATCVLILRTMTDLPPFFGLASATSVGLVTYALASLLLRVRAFKELLSVASEGWKAQAARGG